MGNPDIRTQARVGLITSIKGRKLLEAFTEVISDHQWKIREIQVVSGDKNLYAFGAATDDVLVEIAIGVGEQALPEVDVESMYGLVYIRSFSFSFRNDINFLHEDFVNICTKIAKELEEYLLRH